MSELDTLLNQHLQEGELHSSGTFTVDLEKAKEKSQRFGQENPEKAVLRLLQVLISTLPQQVSIKMSKDRVVIMIEGAQAVKEDLGQLRGELGSSLWSCVYSGFPEVKVFTSKHSWVLKEEGVEELNAESSHHHNTVVLSLSMSQQEESFWDSMRRLLRGRNSITFALGQELRFAPVKVVLDSRVLSGQRYRRCRKAAIEVFLTGSSESKVAEICSSALSLSRPLHSFSKDQRLRSKEQAWNTFLSVKRPGLPKPFGIRSKSWITVKEESVLAHLWLPASAGDTEELVLVKHGVVVGRIPSAFPGIVSAHGLDTDATGLAVVRNQKLEKLTEYIRYSLSRELKRAKALDPPSKIKKALWSI